MFKFLLAKQASSSGFALFAGGTIAGSGPYYATTDKYNFQTSITSAGTVLVGVARYGMAGCSSTPGHL